jgi:hypothetical protein
VGSLHPTRSKRSPFVHAGNACLLSDYESLEVGRWLVQKACWDRPPLSLRRFSSSVSWCNFGKRILWVISPRRRASFLSLLTMARPILMQGWSIS